MQWPPGQLTGSPLCCNLNPHRFDFSKARSKMSSDDLQDNGDEVKRVYENKSKYDEDDQNLPPSSYSHPSSSSKQFPTERVQKIHAVLSPEMARATLKWRETFIPKNNLELGAISASETTLALSSGKITNNVGTSSSGQPVKKGGASQSNTSTSTTSTTSSTSSKSSNTSNTTNTTNSTRSNPTNSSRLPNSPNGNTSSPTSTAKIANNISGKSSSKKVDVLPLKQITLNQAQCNPAVYSVRCAIEFSLIFQVASKLSEAIVESHNSLNNDTKALAAPLSVCQDLVGIIGKFGNSISGGNTRDAIDTAKNTQIQIKKMHAEIATAIKNCPDEKMRKICEAELNTLDMFATQLKILTTVRYLLLLLLLTSLLGACFVFSIE